MQNKATMPLNKYFQLIKPEYDYIQVVPHKSTRNYNSTNIAKAIQQTYKSINKRIKIDKKKILRFVSIPTRIQIEKNLKFSYIIDIKNDNASFYFLVPHMFKNQMFEKIRETWTKVEINIVPKIEDFNDKTMYYQLNNKKEDALSLQVDKKSNEPLNSLLSVMEIMEADDRLTLIYNFLPKSQFNWKKKYQTTRKKIEDMKVIEKDKTTPEYIAKATLSVLNHILTSLKIALSDFSGNDKVEDNMLTELLVTSKILETNKELSNATNMKRDKKVLDTQILIASNSVELKRQEDNVQSVTQSFQVIDEDNELISKKVNLRKKEIISMEDYKFKHVHENTFSVDEIQNFIQQPGRLLMRTLGIKHIEVSEVNVPLALQKGYVCLGEVKCKGSKRQSYIEDVYNIGSLPLIMIGAQGSGKSTYGANYFKFVNSRKEGGVAIDFIKNCEMSDEIISYLPSDDTVILNYNKEEDIQGFAFNEYKIDPEMSVYDKLKLTNLQAQQILTFVDSINTEQPMQARMRKYLSAAANVVLATGETSLKEVVNCMEDFKVRASYMSKLSDEEKDKLSDEIKALNKLDEYSKVTKDNPVPEVIGTIESKIDAVLDRISLLQEDFNLKTMFNKGAEGNIDFAEELEKGKTIIIRMPQDSFKKHVKNVIVTFLLSKIWIATEIRGKLNNQPKPTHIFIDEIFQTKTAMNMLAKDEILPQTRKFGCKFILSCQYTEQIDILMDTLIGAGSSFMLMRGTSEKDYNRFKDQLVGFEYEDLKDMAKYHSLNLIYYSTGSAAFISKLPSPI